MSVRVPASADGGVGIVVPAVFVVLWATGFVVARLAMPHVPPLGFLALRFAATLVVLGPLILAARAPWPSWRDARHLAVAGLMLHAGHLAGVWTAVALGMSAGLVALIVNLQPVLTAAVAGARRRTVGDSWAFGRRTSSVDICPLVAATFARWGYISGEAAHVDVAANIW